MKYLSICSGIEAATQAWHVLGWQAVAFAEIEPFPAAVLAHHYPEVPNLGDMTRWRDWPEELLREVDILVGGTPCQAFSIAGLRESLADERGNLTLILVHLYDHITSIRHAAGRPAPLLLWENVPGVLNTKDNAFGCFLGGLAGEDGPLRPPGKRWTDAGYVRGPGRAIAWRILDAQYFGLAQRRRRVFALASPRDGPSPEQVLFEFDGLRRDSPPSREEGEGSAAGTLRSTQGGSDVDHAIAGHLHPVAFGGNNTSGSIDASPALNANRGCHNPGDFEAGTLLVAPPLTTSPYADNQGREACLIPTLCPTLRAGGNKTGGDRPPGTDVDTCESLIPEVLPFDGALSKDSQPHVVIAQPFAIQAGAIKENPAIGPDGLGIRQDGCAYTLEARSEVQVVAFNLRGREGGAMPEADPDNLACQRAASGGSSRSYIAFSAKDYGADASENLCPTLRAGQHKNSHANSGNWPAIAFPEYLSGTQCAASENLSPTLQSVNPTAVAFSARARGDDGRGYDRPPQVFGDVVGNLDTMKPHNVAQGYAVRRLTPTECERLQGFPDDYTRIPTWKGWRAMADDESPEQCRKQGLKVRRNKKTGKWRVKDVDGPRYKAIGNSMGVTVMRWIGRRIAASSYPKPSETTVS